MLQAACQQFLGKREEDIRRIALETLEGHQRAIMGNMTVEVMYMLLRYLYIQWVTGIFLRTYYAMRQKKEYTKLITETLSVTNDLKKKFRSQNQQ